MSASTTSRTSAGDRRHALHLTSSAPRLVAGAVLGALWPHPRRTAHRGAARRARERPGAPGGRDRSRTPSASRCSSSPRRGCAPPSTRSPARPCAPTASCSCAWRASRWGATRWWRRARSRSARSRSRSWSNRCARRWRGPRPGAGAGARAARRLLEPAHADRVARRRTDALQRETRNLVTALRRPEVRGRWGELTLRRLVELAGLSEHCDFTEQLHCRRRQGALRPDLVVHLPDARDLVIDAKTPLDAYLEALDAPTEEQRALALARHAQQVETRVRELGLQGLLDAIRAQSRIRGAVPAGRSVPVGRRSPSGPSSSRTRSRRASSSPRPPR